VLPCQLFVNHQHFEEELGNRQCVFGYLSLFLSLNFRAWESLSGVTCCRSLVVIYDYCCILQIGLAA
jgi:hypothetical protein